MTRTHISTIALAFATLFAGQAMAASVTTTLTRDQVKAELSEAVRTGNISSGESGVMLNELYPQNYPGQQVSSSLTREQVKADLAEAKRTGHILADDSSLKLNEQFPHLYPEQQATTTMTRAQVKAELAEAKNMGMLPFNMGA